MKNVVLIGMPGSGKSTVGVLLAKALGYDFLDVDLVIQKREHALLQDILDRRGLDAFLQAEEDAVCSVSCENTVIAPGGSVIYGAEAMAHLKEIGLVVYLKISYEELTKRLGNIVDRGVVLKEGMTLKDLYEERAAYFERYADITIDEEGKDLGQVVDELRRILEERLS